MTLHIALRPETEARLRQRAAADGKDVGRFVVEAVEEKLASSSASDAAELSPEQRAAEWRAWTASHPRRDFVADDGRDCIYAGRGE